MKAYATLFKRGGSAPAAKWMKILLLLRIFRFGLRHDGLSGLVALIRDAGVDRLRIL
jgi:hypothetical protein